MRRCISSIWRLSASMSSDAGIRGLSAGLVAVPASLALAPRERREHGERLLEHLHVAPDLLFHRTERTERRHRRRRPAPSAGASFPVPGEGFQRHFEIARHHHLHGVAVEADQLAQEIDRKEVLAFLVFLLEDDLGQHRAGDVLAGLGVEDDEIFAGLHHGRQVFQRHIGAGAGVVEAPVGVFLDRDGFVGFCHDHRLRGAR